MVASGSEEGGGGRIHLRLAMGRLVDGGLLMVEKIDRISIVEIQLRR